MARKNYQKGQLPFDFVAVPKDILRSSEWHALAPSAMRLAFDLMAQYSGKNNGRLCPSFEAMQRCGWRSETTLIKAKRELLECSFVVHTRRGHRPHTADWLAFTWWKLDWEQSMDIGPRGFPYLNFVRLEVATAKTIPVLQKLELPTSKQPSRPTETVALRAVR
ncbi:hypothetical protein [Pseudorhodoferax sp. Leaf274]|uniref:hypothetical protein n=1 Tax=Pseudorhodoferax sp. Leaf274 TaxID=1736318 RepID=UPI0007035246|nr:hypothetical protein [Pseudorhodoferax sp. Leaf274]KQP35860.1 hypothetical protein ASF44_21425 [Pseudorhodoferax sp. Leaf274]